MIYLGNIEIPAIYLGNDIIPAIYCGTELIYPTAITGLTIKPTEICFYNSGETTTIKVASESDWEIISYPSWCILSQTTGTSGRTNVNVTSGQYQGELTDSIVFKTTDSAYTATLSVSASSVHYVNWIYTTGNETEFIDTGIYLTSASVIDVVWRYHFDSTFNFKEQTQNVGGSDFWRVFIFKEVTKTKLYYDWVNVRKTINWTPNTADVLNWKIGNYYIKNNTTGSYLISGSTLTAFTPVETFKVCLGKEYIKSIKITEPSGVVFEGEAALDSNNVPCIYDTISHTYKYYTGTQEYLAYS